MSRTPAAHFSVLLACALATSCVSSGYERASDAADETESYRSDLVDLRTQVALATEALRALSENPGDSPRSNQETFQTFALEVSNLERATERSRREFARMDGRAERFFGGWNVDTAEISNADLKRSAETRRATLRANFEKLAQGQLAAEQGLARFVEELRDLSVYLENDLTSAGIALARARIAEVFAHGAQLQDQLEAQARSTAEARDSLAPLRDLAPSQQPRAGASSRVQ